MLLASLGPGADIVEKFWVTMFQGQWQEEGRTQPQGPGKREFMSLTLRSSAPPPHPTLTRIEYLTEMPRASHPCTQPTTGCSCLEKEPKAQREQDSRAH